MSHFRIGVAKNFECHLNDLAIAFWKVANTYFGEGCIVGYKERFFFSRNDVQFVSIKTDKNEYLKGVVGPLAIKGVPGYFIVGAEEGPIIAATVKKEFEGKVNEFYTKISDYIKEHSIYKGKAITSNLEFMDLSGICPDDFTYSEEVLDDLKENVWFFINKIDDCKMMNIKIQRKVAFVGKFGSGKTIAAFLTAKIATENGYGFIYMEPSSNSKYSMSIDAVLRFARISHPCVVLFEDWDREQRGDNSFALGHIMTSIDGILSKNSEVIIIFTTNYPNKIAAGMQRPGRVDKFIDFDRFNEKDVIKLLKKSIAEEFLDPGIDWHKVAKSCEGYSAVFVGDVGTSAKLKSIRLADIGGNRPIVTQDMLISAARSLDGQNKKCLEAVGFTSQNSNK